MNKVILMGRLTRDPEVRYSQGTPPMAIARYAIAVNRRFKRDGEQEADFINIVAFGKAGEFAEKYFKKGQQIVVVGRLQTGSYEKEGVKHYTTDVIAEEQEFAESKKNFEERVSGGQGNEGYTPKPASKSVEGFVPVEEDFDDDIPF